MAELANKLSNSLEEKLLSAAFFCRRDFFKLWNQIRNSEDTYLTPEEKCQLIFEKLEGLSPIHLQPPIRFISMLSAEYPQILLELPQPPLGLFILGSIGAGPFVGIVGSRKPTPYSQRVTRDVARIWSSQGLCIVSGGAYGIDSIAHQTTLENNGKTIAVLGGGLRRLYPKTHIRIFEEILKKGGALVSEYPPETDVRPYFFPERNRIIAALSDSLFLAQAHEKSGSLLTARAALDMGREIFVLRPIQGDVLYAGSQSLIEAGAHCLIDAKELHQR
ncbi:MAG: DNA-processing protein DprA [Deltaproteobacteria bacterium]|nr:DNA-processing protein DprA [Deltaproteobacteria bacterium]